jgi:hypothetical protein
MNVQFKDNVYGFIYDSQYSKVKRYFTKPLTESEEKIIASEISEYESIYILY